MGGVPSNVRGKIYSEVEIDDDFGTGLGLGLGAITFVPAVAQAIAAAVVVVVVDDTSSGFNVGSTYVKMVCWRGR